MLSINLDKTLTIPSLVIGHLSKLITRILLSMGSRQLLPRMLQLDRATLKILLVMIPMSSNYRRILLMLHSGRMINRRLTKLFKML